MGSHPVKWPAVMGEFETMRAVAAGGSIARFGDGELKIIYGSGYVRELPCLALATELFEVLGNEERGLLVGIPTLDPAGPKIENWRRHEAKFLRVLGAGPYFSAFVTRPDSAPWILTQEYLEIVLSVWAGRRVALVAEKTSKIPAVVRVSAASTAHISCPRHGAYARIEVLEASVLAAKPDLAVLSCGPTATCLVRRLHRKGLQAVDLGSAGGFLSGLLAARARDPAE